jgi:8-oxo-dGTP pyrophosphatase MutT (NUDIX family)
MDRHMTVSGFVAHEGRVALHWHRKLGMWLPAGGHIEPNEDPLEAVLREIREEFAVEAEPLPLAPMLAYTGGPRPIQPPFVILDCWPEPDHGHIDHVYLCRLVSGYPGKSYDPENPITWLDAEQLRLGAALAQGQDKPFPPDVLALALETLKQAERLSVPATS